MKSSLLLLISTTINDLVRASTPNGESPFTLQRLGSDRDIVYCFLGQNHSVSLLNSSSECKGNCIYFTDDYFDSLDKERVVDCGGGFNKEGLVDGSDFGVFDLEDGSIKPILRHGFSAAEFSWPTPPSWVVFEAQKDIFAESYVSGFPVLPYLYAV